MPRATVDDGVGLEYLLQGRGPRVAVLLNGIAMTIAHWKPVADRLAAAGWRVLMHDMRGQSLSDMPEGGYSLELHARDLAALMDGLGVDAAHVIGTSYGAEVALTFARDYPGRCLSVASLAGVSEYDAVLGAAVRAWRSAALADPRAFYRTILPWNYSAAYLEANAELLARREEGIAALPRRWFEAFASLCDAFLAIDLTKDLGRIRCPCLALAASLDILKGPAYSRLIAAKVPGARYEELPGSGHAMVLERPDAVADSLLRFLPPAGAAE